MINHIYAKCFLPHPLLHKSAHELDGFGSSANSAHHTLRFNANLTAVQTQNTATPVQLDAYQLYKIQPTASHPLSVIQTRKLLIFGAQHPHSKETQKVAQTRYASTNVKKM